MFDELEHSTFNAILVMPCKCEDIVDAQLVAVLSPVL